MKNINNILFPKIKSQLLSLFILNPDKQFYTREIIRRIKSNPGPVQRELKALTEAEIITKQKLDSDRVYYKINKNVSIYNELRGIIIKTFGIGGLIEESLDSIKEKLKLALIFGSVAKGEDTGTSDVDVLIVGDVSFKEIAIIFDPIEKLINRSINPTVYSIEQFESKYTSDNHFIKTIMNDKYILLYGIVDDPSELA